MYFLGDSVSGGSGRLLVGLFGSVVSCAGGARLRRGIGIVRRGRGRLISAIGRLGTGIRACFSGVGRLRREIRRLRGTDRSWCN